MQIQSAQWNANHDNINVSLADGTSIFVPDDPLNMRRQMLQDWEQKGSQISPYQAPVPARSEMARSLIANAFGDRRASLNLYGVSLSVIPPDQRTPDQVADIQTICVLNDWESAVLIAADNPLIPWPSLPAGAAELIAGC